MEGNLEPGTEFAGYRIEGVAGRGGMGVVYRATQLALDRVVALKLVVPDLAADADFRQRFQRESRVAAAIDHPNAVPVYEAGEEAGRLYISMRYVEGTDLRTLVAREGKLEPHRAVRIVAQVAAALDAAHARGLVHRDVKPANVLIEERDSSEHAYLTDFGLTRHAEGHSEITQTGAWVGTLDYASPEQIEGRGLDARADVYALGCLLYKALTGKAPFADRQDVAKIYAHMNEPPAAVSESTPDAPVALDGVLERALAKDPDARFPSAGDLGRVALAAAEGIAAAPGERSVATGDAAPRGGSVATEPIVPTAPRFREPEPRATAAPPSSPTPPRRGRALALGWALLAAAVVVAGAAFALTREDERSALEATSFATTSIAVGETPAGLAVGESAVWVALDEESRIKRIEPETGEVTDSIDVSAGTDGALAVAGGMVWVRSGDVVTRIDAEAKQVVGNPIEVPSESDGEIAAAQGTVWAANPSADTVSKIDAGSGRVTELDDLPDVGPDIAVGEGAVWVTTSDEAGVSKLDPESGELQETTTISSEDSIQFGGSVAAGEGGVWVTNPDADVDTLARIDPASGDVDADPIGLPDGFDGDVAVGGGAVWVRNSADGSVIRVDPATKRVVGLPIPAGSDAEGRVVVGFGSAWVSQSEGDTVARLEF